MRICITGGLGLIGLPLVRLLNKSGCQILVIDKLEPTIDLRSDLKNTKFVTTSFDSVLAFEEIEKFQPEALVHLAAQKDVLTSIMNPVGDAELNVLSALKLYRKAVESGVEKFIFASSGGALYSRFAHSPYDENAGVKPESPYGVSKLAFELYLESMARQDGIQYLNMRLANVYGLGDRFAGVIPKFVNAANEDKIITIYGDGTTTRDYVFSQDVAMAFFSAMNSSFSGNINIGSGIETNLLDLVDVIEDVLDRRVRIEYKPLRNGEVLNSVLDCKLAAVVFNWKPEFTLHGGIIECVEEWGLSFGK